MSKHMHVCEIMAPHGGGAIFPPTTVNFTENGTVWLSVKHKRLFVFLSKDLVFYGHLTSIEKPKHLFTYSMDRALTFSKGDNSGTVNII